MTLNKLVNKIRDELNEVDKIVVRMDFIENKGPVDIRVTKTEFRNHLKGINRNEELNIFFEDDTMIVNTLPGVNNNV